MVVDVMDMIVQDAVLPIRAQLKFLLILWKKRLKHVVMQLLLEEKPKKDFLI